MHNSDPALKGNGLSTKVVTAQFGARHNYAVPAAFASRGRLEAFYTDLCATNGVGRSAPILSSLPGGSRSLRALGNRRPPPAVTRRTTTFDILGLTLWSKLRSASPVQRLRLWDQASEAFGIEISKRGFGDAEHLYGVMNELGGAYRDAQKQGIKTAVDVCVAPSWERLVQDELKQFPEWGSPQPLFADALGVNRSPYRYMFDGVDCYVCPSEFVRNDLIDNFGVPTDHTSLVPYAVSEQWFKVKSTPIPGRVLFVGSANLRKGIHYLAKAADMLKQQGDDYEFRVAGDVSNCVRHQPESAALNFLGRIPRSEVFKEFAEADILVLPSIAEGSATVIYEALAVGLPVITTTASGSEIRDGEEGVILSTLSPETLANEISAMVTDRARRDRMAHAAHIRAHDFTWSRYSERLTECVS